MDEGDEYSDKTSLVRSTQRSFFGKDGIVRQIVIPGTELMAEEAQEMLERHSKQVGGKKLRVLVNTSGVAFTTQQVRAAFARPETVSLLSAVALVITSSTNRLLGNLSLWFNRAKVPIRFFTAQDEALAWLKSFPE